MDGEVYVSVHAHTNEHLRCTKCEVNDHVRKHIIRCTEKGLPRFLVFEALLFFQNIGISDNRSRFELSVSRSQNAIYFSIIAIPKKSHFTFLRYKTLCKIRKNRLEFHLYCWDHVCKVNVCKVNILLLVENDYNFNKN